MTPDKIAEKVSKELDKLCKKYNCDVGVWLTWRDLMHNLDQMKARKGFNEAHFGLQIRIHGTDDKDKKSNKGTAK